MASDGSSEAYMQIFIGYDGQPPIREVGRVLDRLGFSYERYAQEKHGVVANLTVETVEIGSLFAILKSVVDATSAALSIYEHRNMVAGFIDHLGIAIAAIREGDPAFQIPPYLRALIRSLSKPLADRRATNVTLTAEFNDRGRVTLDNLGGDDLMKALAMVLAAMGGSGEGGALPGQQTRDHSDNASAHKPYAARLWYRNDTYLGGWWARSTAGTGDTYFQGQEVVKGLDTRRTYKIEGYINPQGTLIIERVTPDDNETRFFPE